MISQKAVVVKYLRGFSQFMQICIRMTIIKLSFRAIDLAFEEWHDRGR
jgi:hypothetical protein